MTSGIHEFEYSRLPVLMNMNNVFKYKCVSNLQVKPGYTRKSPGIPEKYPSARPHAAHALLAGPLRQLRRAPPAQVRAPHHVRSLQVPKKARLAGGGADDAVVPTFCFKRHPGPGAPQASRPAGGAAAGRPRCARRWLRLEAGLATEVLAFFWHPHNIAHHPRVHQQFALLAAVCRCILVLEDQLACSTSTRPIVAVHRAAASLSTPPSECVGVWPA